MVVTFGGVAGVLVAGLQLTSLKDTTGQHRTDALVGYGLAIGGVLFAILAAAVTLTAGRRTLEGLKGTGGCLTLRRHLNKMTDLRAGFDSIDELVKKTNEVIKSRTDAWVELQKAPEDTAKKQDYAKAKEAAKIIVPVADRLLETASFEQLRRTWAVCRILVVAGALVAAIGVAIFAANAEQPKDEKNPTIASTPVVGIATLTSAGIDAHRGELGSRCRRTRIAAIVTGADEKAYTLLVVPTRTNPCGPADISLERSEGSVRAGRRVDLSP
jgi:hypothetical protein